MTQHRHPLLILQRHLSAFVNRIGIGQQRLVAALSQQGSVQLSVQGWQRSRQGCSQILAQVNRQHRRLQAVLIKKGNLPLQNRPQIDGFDSLQTSLARGLGGCHQRIANPGKGFYLALAVPAVPGIAPIGLYAVLPTRVFFRISARVDAELERRATPDRPQAFQMLLQPTAEGIIRTGLVVGRQRHARQLIQWPALEKTVPQRFALLDWLVH